MYYSLHNHNFNHFSQKLKQKKKKDFTVNFHYLSLLTQVERIFSKQSINGKSTFLFS